MSATSRPSVGYVLPTRESIMAGRPAALPLIALAERAESLGYDSIWIGDSLLARPRHDPLTLLAGVAARTKRMSLGTAVLLPALRNPVVLAHQVSTLDQIAEGRIILGVGIAADVPSIRAEFEAAGVPFEKRVGRMLEGLQLCRALWSGKPVDWDGRWKVRGGVLGPVPYRPGGPPIWIGGAAEANIDRVGKTYEGWFPTSTSPEKFADHWRRIGDVARSAGRDPKALTGAIYLTVAIDDDVARANQATDRFLEQYYGVKAAIMRKLTLCYAGPKSGVGEWLGRYVAAGASHLVLRFVGEHERHLDLLAGIGAEIAR